MSQTSDLKVIYKADFDSPSGYSRAARAHAKALIGAGVDVLFEPHKHDTTSIVLDEWWKQQLPARMQRQERAPIKIWHETPEFYMPSPAHKNVAMLAWETDGIPNIDGPNPRHNWTKQLNKMDLVFTFCQSAKKAMETSGVTTPIEVVGHPIDPAIYYPAEPDLPKMLYNKHRQPLEEAFRFLGVFQWTPRKDPYVLLKAYFTEFSPADNAVLILKTYYTKVGDIDTIRQQIEAVRRNIRLPHAHPKVYLVPTMMTDAEMVDLLRSADCHVSSSRGEGFCLPVAESMACGVPAIVPKGSAFLDYVTENVGYLVKTIEEPVYGLPHVPWYHSTQHWHTANILDLGRRMREAYENRVGLEDRARKAPKAIAVFSPEVIGKKMAKALRRLVARTGRDAVTATSTP